MGYKQTIGIGRTNAAILAGEDDLSEWDDEELRRGQRRDKHGRWRGRPPTVVPKVLHDELYRRRIEHATGMLRESLPKAIEAIADIAFDRSIEATVRLNASKWIAERLLGKAPENINVRAELEIKPWMKALTDGLVEGVVGSEVEAEVIDVQAQPVSEDDLLWDEVIGQAAPSSPHRPQPEPPEPPEPMPAYDDTELWERVNRGR